MAAAFDPWRQEVEGLIDAGEDRVLALMRLTARGKESGVPVQFSWAMVMTVSGGRVAASHAFIDQNEARAAAGLVE